MRHSEALNPQFFDGKQVAAALCISARTLARLTANGTIASVRIGRLRRYPVEAVLSFANDTQAANLAERSSQHA
jgi:excisionase family DNA binding protein